MSIVQFICVTRRVNISRFLLQVEKSTNDNKCTNKQKDKTARYAVERRERERARKIGNEEEEGGKSENPISAP
jgi:hypothetical protein